MRQSWGITESPRFSDGVTQVLVDNVSEVDFQHYDATGNISPLWPPISSSTPDVLPKMIRVTIRLQDGTESTRLILGVDR